jgi:DNA-nicking Smr family endonuclease
MWGRRANKTLTLDLHPFFRNEREVDRAVRAIIFKAARTGVTLVEIIPGKGRGQLRSRVLALLRQSHLRQLYARIEVDPDNAGRILVHFR